MTPREIAQAGLEQLKEAILELLQSEPRGLTNADIVTRLDLQSDFEGHHRNYLSWSVLGILLREKKVKYVGSRQDRRYLLAGGRGNAGGV